MINTYFGRLTYDVKVDTVGSEGKKVLNNRIAIKLSKNQTTFIDIVAWEGTADLIGKHFKKGYEILFQGKLINKKKLIGDGVEVECHALLIDEVIFTNGNSKDKAAPANDSYIGDSETDFV
jgi:single-stranded DNA-binding protein